MISRNVTSPLIDQTIQAISPLNQRCMQQIAEQLEGLLKPPGSLGRLESLAIQLAGITQNIANELTDKRVIVFAADHGVFAENVAITPQAVTQIQAANMVKGLTGVCALAQSVNSQVVVVDVGIKSEPIEGVLNHKIRAGCNNIAQGPAMSHAEAIQAIEIGIRVTQEQIRQGAQLLAIGELGIANTTPAAAIVSILCQASVEDVVGLGANLPPEKWQHKVNVVKQAIENNQPNSDDAIDIVAKVGGFELAAMAGALLAAAAMRVPVVLDGFLSYSSALLACQLCPELQHFLIPSHLSAEKGAQIALQQLHLTPYLNMAMRLGEGSGAVLLFPIIDAACSMTKQMGKLSDSHIVLPN